MTSPSRVLRPYVMRQWRALTGAGLATGVLAAAELAKPWPLALIVDHVLEQRTVPFELTAADLRAVLLVGGLILAIAVAESSATYFSDLWMQSAGERITHELRVAVYDHLQRLSLAFHQRSQKGDLLTRVTGDVRDMGQLFSDTLKEMLQSALLALGMTVVLLFIDPVLALLSLSTAPILVVISWIFRRRVRDRARKQRRHEGDLASVANEALSAMAVVKAFGAEDMESERVRSRSEQRMGAGVEVARLQAQLRRHRRRPARVRDRDRDRVRRHPRIQGRALGRRPDRVRQLHAQGVEPDAQLRPRGDQARGGDGAGGADRRDCCRPTR